MENGNLDSSPYSFPTTTFHTSNLNAFPDLQFGMDSNKPSFHSQMTSLSNKSGAIRQRKRQSRHSSQIPRGSSMCMLCEVTVNMDGLSHVNHVFQHVESSGLGPRFNCSAPACDFSHYKKGLLEQHCKKDHDGNPGKSGR